MSFDESSFHSRAECEVRSAMCASSNDPSTEPRSLFEEAWMQLGDRLRHSTSHLAPRTSQMSEANLLSEREHA